MGTASAVPTPDAGTDRSINEDASDTYTGSDASTEGVTFGWVFDGNVVDGMSVSYTFDTPGVYVVDFWADDGIGGNVTDQAVVTVIDITNPVANAGSDQSVNEDTVVTFDGSGSSDNDPNFATTGRYYWTFTDGSTARSLAGQSAGYTFNTPGSFIVNLLVFDDEGNFASDSLVVSVGDVTAPSGSTSVPSSANEDSSVAFLSSAVTDNDPNFASTRRDYWTFMDGATPRNLSGPSQSYTFNTPGAFSITLTVMDAAGNAMVSVYALTIVDITAPTGSGSIPSPSNEDASITFNAASITDNDPTFSSNRRIYWTFTDGAAQNLTSPSGTGTSTYTFATPGVYSITLTVMDAIGNKLTQVISVTIRDITPPSGGGSVPANANEDTVVSFSSSAITDNDPTFSGTPNRRDYWTFTDGTARNLSGTGPSYTFATPGTFSITLLVMDITGNRLTGSFTIVIRDVTAPTPITISGGGVSVERFRSSTQTGSASDNVGVAAYWWLFTDVTAQNISGTTLTRTWSNTGSFSVTFYARDAAFNIASTSTTITVTADVTPPTVTTLAAPTTGDDQNALIYTFTATDLDPTCAASCVWTWQRDGVVTNTGVQTLSVLWTPGRHSLSVLVSDPTGNTRNVTITPIDIDQVVSIDTLVTGQTFELNWNIRIQNGATLTWRNSIIYNTSLTPPRTVVISVAAGRFLLENSQMISNATTYGFRLVANGTGGAGSYIFINQSTISGLYYNALVPAVSRAPISINDGTLSVRDSILRDVRLTGSSTTPQAILGTNANLYFNNVTLNATVTTTMGGIRADYTNVITVFATREIVIDRLDGRSGRSPIQFAASSGTTGTVNMTILNSLLRASSGTTTNRAIDIALTSASGTFNFRLANVDASFNNYGGIYAVQSSFTGVSNYNITDTTFDSAISANGMYFQWTNSNARYTIALFNVSSQRASQFGLQTRFETSGWNQGTMMLNQVRLDNSSAQSGWYFYHYNSRLTSWVDVVDSTFNFNRQNGIWIDSQTSPQYSVHSFNFTRVQIADNQQLYGIRDSIQSASFNHTMNFVDTSVVRNYNDNLYFYHYATNTIAAKHRGDYWFNLTRSEFSNSQQGRGMYFYMYYYVQQNVSGYWTDSSINNNRLDGIYYYHGFLYTNSVDATESNLTLWADRVSISRNGQDGFYAYDYYMYGYLTYTCNPACGYYQVSAATNYHLYFNDSHIDSNLRRGFEWYGCPGYCNYGAVLMHLYLTEGTTVSDNAASGVYLNFWYAYTYGWLGGTSVGPGSSEMTLDAVNASIQRNGFSGSDGYGIYSGFYFSYGMGPMYVNAIGSTISDNAGTGIFIDHDNNYFASSGSDDMWIDGSDISNNGAHGIETYRYQVYQLNGGVNDHINNTTFTSNGGAAMMHNSPESYGRYFSPWSVKFTNNRVDQSPTTAIERAPSYSCQGCGGYGGSETFNFSGNTFTNIQGAAIAWSFDPPNAGSSIDVDISNNYVADVEDGITFGASGTTGTQHTWTVQDNLIERSNGNGMLLSMPNEGSGAQGILAFQRNEFRNMGGTAFTLVQNNIKLSTLVIKDCIFNVQRTGMVLSGIVGQVDNATFIGSIKEDIVLTDGLLEIHNTPVDPLKLKPVGTASAFNVYFHLQVNVVWAGTGKSVIGAVVQMADSGGGTFFVGSISDDTGIPDRDLWSYTKSTQGVLGRTPFRISVTYFEIEQIESIDLFQNRVVFIELRDNVDPTVVISNPDDNFGTRDYTIQVDGSVFDSQSGFVFDINDPQLPSMYVEMSTDAAVLADPLDWSVAHVKSSSAFEIQFDYVFTGLGEDVHALLVRVHDDAGNFVTRVIPVNIDRSAPVVNIIFPSADRIITNRETVTISAETEVGALIFVNGQQPPEIFTRPDHVTAYFTMELPVFEGPNTIIVAAIDALNNQGEDSLYAFVDLQPPYLAVTAPEVNALTNRSSIVVEGQTEEVNVTVTVNGLPATIDLQGNFTVTIPLALDVNRLNILATDGAGNTELVVRDVRVDRTAPWINVQSPVSNALVNSAEVDVIGIVEPGATLIVNDEVVAAPTGAFSRRILLTEGENTIQFVAIDPAGNTGFLTRFVTVDSIEPVLTVTSPANESLINAGTAVVTGTITDDHSTTLMMNGQDIQLGPGGSFSIVATLYEGTNFITLDAMDGAGNHQVRVLMVVSDTLEPELHPELSGTFLDGAQVTTYDLSVTVLGFAEKGAELEVCSVPAGSTTEVCNAIPLAADGKFQTFVELKANSVNTINVVATDAAGNENSRQLQVVQTDRPVAVAPPAPVGLYALYLAGLGLLGGAFFLLYMRRGRRDPPTELSAAESMPYSAPMDMPPPQMGGDVGTASAEMAAAPEVSGDVDVTTAPADGFEGGDGMSPPDESMAAGAMAGEAPRSRPLRRRAGDGALDGGEGGGLAGMGAEEEALPGDTHQDEQKEG